VTHVTIAKATNGPSEKFDEDFTFVACLVPIWERYLNSWKSASFKFGEIWKSLHQHFAPSYQFFTEMGTPGEWWCISEQLQRKSELVSRIGSPTIKCKRF
jgi:hypothetical protein